MHQISWNCIAAGGSHSLAIRSDGARFAWRKDVNGQLGMGTTVNSRTPLQVGVDVDWVNIAAGAEHSTATRANSTYQRKWAQREPGPRLPLASKPRLLSAMTVC
jgi:alpha-tubulin suppressor-like RCC1 family protein